MIKDKIVEVLNNIKNHMSEKRYLHTLGVVDAAVYLADKYGENIEEAKLAALLHDYAKDFTEEELKNYIHRNGIDVDEILIVAYQLLHGRVGAHIAKNRFHINNQDILNAIDNHTTGSRNMSNLEKIIYLADFIEVGRDYPGVDDLRIVAEESLDKAVLQALNNTIKYVLSIDKLLHPNTIYARNELMMKREKGE
ncbi:bis(5'-nucleosyl)-tetraphosphatase (symmetrical) YqeK [Alkaliphilus serpentinus]|uniref:bis(5'-nucleosyl)-tetraphosphatase (symmetrical) n=1 Tax=Alkaliphilus serpentinus TaxID=1482731 RepID=A0A833HR87_9FIRM|nr:bis(5'-nucleosyl)-tetraphosphatase (symmetrical) YqeK [Alkaliphilus serpentinus]KAB3533117.1 HD domain-containing protein [Alkaliphilus serpentinus]